MSVLYQDREDISHRTDFEVRKIWRNVCGSYAYIILRALCKERIVRLTGIVDILFLEK